MTRPDPFRSRRAGFTSEHDTLMASVVRTSKQGPRGIKPIERPANPAYTVQIGAFARTDHALQVQRLAKDRFADLPIFNTFESYDRLYRVRIGKYNERQQADSLREWMIRQFPGEYADSWVNYISK